MKRQIPSLITLMNLLCGVVALIVLFKMPDNDMESKAWVLAGLMSAALAFDFADGLVARLLGVSSEIGKQLDSLADMVTFGVLPGVLVFFVLDSQVYDVSRDYLPSSWVYGVDQPYFYHYLPYVGLLIPLFSAWRLAKFNVDTRQTDHFRGLATPTNAFFFLSIFMMYCMDVSAGMEESVGWSNFPKNVSMFPPKPEFSYFSFLYQPVVLSLLTVLFSILMLTNIPLIAIKTEDYSFGKNVLRYLLLGISLILLLVFRYKAVPMILVLYFLLSFIDRSLKKT